MTGGWIGRKEEQVGNVPFPVEGGTGKGKFQKKEEGQGGAPSIREPDKEFRESQMIRRGEERTFPISRGSEKIFRGADLIPLRF